MSPAKVRWGFLSTARINRRLLAAAEKTDAAEVVAVASRDSDRAEAYAVEHGISRSHGSYEALLEDSEVDAVYISLPNSLHVEWSVRALAAGKHVLCEKPLTRSPEEAEYAFEAADRAGRILMEAFMWRHSPQTAKLAQLVEGGRRAGGPPRKRLLAEHVLAGLRGAHGPLDVQRVGQRHVHGVDVRVGEQRLVAPVRARDAVLGGVGLGTRLVAARHRDDVDGIRERRAGEHGAVDLRRREQAQPQRHLVSHPPATAATVAAGAVRGRRGRGAAAPFSIAERRLTPLRAYALIGTARSMRRTCDRTP